MRRKSNTKYHIEYRVHVEIRLAKTVGDPTKHSAVVIVFIFKEELIKKAKRKRSLMSKCILNDITFYIPQYTWYM